MQLILNGSGSGKKPVSWSGTFEIADDTPEELIDAIALVVISRPEAPSATEFEDIVAAMVSPEIS